MSRSNFLSVRRPLCNLENAEEEAKQQQEIEEGLVHLQEVTQIVAEDGEKAEEARSENLEEDTQEQQEVETNVVNSETQEADRKPLKCVQEVVEGKDRKSPEKDEMEASEGKELADPFEVIERNKEREEGACENVFKDMAAELPYERFPFGPLIKEDAGREVSGEQSVEGKIELTKNALLAAQVAYMRETRHRLQGLMPPDPGASNLYF